MPASEELCDGTVDDNFESCDEGEGEASGNELHAGQMHGLESIAAARPKSQRVASCSEVDITLIIGQLPCQRPSWSLTTSYRYVTHDMCQ